MKTRTFILSLLLVLLCPPAFAQVGQVGTVTPGHAAVWSTPGKIGDAGKAIGSQTFGSGYLTELGITATGTPFCINDALTNGPYHQFCLGASSLGGGLISYNAYNGASALPCNFNINGASYSCVSAGGGNVVGPASSTVGHVAIWNNSGGTALADTGLAITTSTGTLTIANGVTLTVNNILTFNGTDGTTLTFPVITSQLIGRNTIDTLTNKTYDTAGLGNSFAINGTAITAVTGTGSVVLATSPTLVTPTLGAASATTLNKWTFTAPTTAATLTAGADSQTYTLPSATDTLVGRASTDTMSNKTFVSPVLGAATATSINKVAITAPAAAATLTIANNKTVNFPNTQTFAGTDGTTQTFQASDTIVGRATTDTLTNKTLTDSIDQGFVVGTVELDKTNDTGFATIAGLSIALTSAKTYSCAGHITGTSGAAGGAKVQMAATSGLTATSASFTATNWNGTTINAKSTVTSLGSSVGAATAVITDIDIVGAIVVNNGGTINVQFAQNVSNGTTSSAYINSTFDCKRVN